MYSYKDGSKHPVPPIRRTPGPDEVNIDRATALIFAYSLYPVQFAMPAHHILKGIQTLRRETVAGGPMLDALEDTAKALLSFISDSGVLQRSVRERETLPWAERVKVSDPDTIRTILGSMHRTYGIHIARLDDAFRDYVTYMGEYREHFSPEYAQSFDRFTRECEGHLQSIEKGMKAVDLRVRSIAGAGR